MGLLITCTLVTTLYATAMTIANVSLPQIQGALSAGPDQVAWVVTANLIATAVTIPLAGWMSNRFGRRRVMIFGVAGFAGSTLLCGLSSSLEALILWRVFQSAFCSPLAAVAQSVGHIDFVHFLHAKVAHTIKHPPLASISSSTLIPAVIFLSSIYLFTVSLLERSRLSSRLVILAATLSTLLTITSLRSKK